MSSTIFEFGQVRPEYSVPVLNERAVRAAAGILFFLAVISFMNAWLMGNFQLTRVFVVCFLIEFTIRIFINPRFAPLMILGEWMVRKQLPEWTGAPQKRFAWSIGFILAATMLYLVVLNNVIGPVNLIVCSLCLLLMFFETAFGICIGCQIYNLWNKEKAQLCPGGVCEIPPDQIPKMSMMQAAILLAFFAAVFAISQWIYSTAPERVSDLLPAAVSKQAAPLDPTEVERCKVPDFAKAMGHEEKWKLHNNCK
ncbi:MAG: DUF4395 domain-containing protein [Burkholderiaceae bacterium]